MKKPFLVVVWLVSSLVCYAGNELKTEYREASVNTLAEEPINLKEWKTFRGGKLVLEKVARDIANQGTWPQTTYRVFVAKEPVITISHYQGFVSVTYHSTAGVKVLRTDNDKDGFMERFLLLDADEQTIDMLQITKDWDMVPVSEEILAEWLEQMKKIKELSDKMGEVNPD